MRQYGYKQKTSIRQVIRARGSRKLDVHCTVVSTTSTSCPPKLVALALRVVAEIVAHFFIFALENDSLVGHSVVWRFHLEILGFDIFRGQISGCCSRAGDATCKALAADGIRFHGSQTISIYCLEGNWLLGRRDWSESTLSRGSLNHWRFRCKVETLRRDSLCEGARRCCGHHGSCL